MEKLYNNSYKKASHFSLFINISRAQAINDIYFFERPSKLIWYWERFNNSMFGGGRKEWAGGDGEEESKEKGEEEGKEWEGGGGQFHVWSALGGQITG